MIFIKHDIGWDGLMQKAIEMCTSLYNSSLYNLI